MPEDTSLPRKRDNMITIIIPTYNRASVLSKTLPSYLRQKNVDEIIIVNDGGTDPTESIVNSFKNSTQIDIKYVNLGERRGAAYAKLTGILASKNPYIAFGEDDLIFSDDYLQNLFADMIKTGADIIAGRILYLKKGESHDDALRRCNNSKKPLIDYNTLQGYFSVNPPEPIQVPFVHACFLARKAIFSEIDYDTSFQGNGYREETDPQVLALENGKKIIFTPNAICYHLPYSAGVGGGQRMGAVSYFYWSMKNNIHFLRKHNSFLRRRYNTKPFFFMLTYITAYSLKRMAVDVLRNIL